MADVRDAVHILVVDDERPIRTSLRDLLRRQYEYEVAAAASGEEALSLFEEMAFDLVLLDINLPGISGLDVLSAIKRQNPGTLVVILTGHSTVDSAVYALRHGAFDYLSKPISTDEIFDCVHDGLLHARQERQRNEVLLHAQQLLQAGLEKLDEVTPEPVDLLSEADEEEEAPDPDRFLTCGPLTIDTYRRKATLNGELLDLTAGEYDLLLCLARHAPRVMGPPEIVQETRGYECSLIEAREIVRWQVYLLRQKVELDPSSPQYILNVRGRGYMWAGA